MNIKNHKIGCMANMKCMVIHPDGVCPGPYGKCTCDSLPPEDINKSTLGGVYSNNQKKCEHKKAYGVSTDSKTLRCPDCNQWISSTENTTKCCEKCSKSIFSLKGRNKEKFGGICGLACECHQKCEEDYCVREKGHTGFHYNPECDKPSLTQPDQKDCKHGNKGVCLGCYDEFRNPKPDTESWEVETHNEIHLLAARAFASETIDEVISHGNDFVERFKELIHQVEEKSYQRGIEEQKALGSEAFVQGRQSAYREMLEIIEKSEGYDSEEYGGEVILKEEQISKLKSKLSQPE